MANNVSIEETITITPEFFEQNGDEASYPTREIFDSDRGPSCYVFGKNYEQYLPDSLVSVIKKLGFFGFALSVDNGGEMMLWIYIGSKPSFSFDYYCEIDRDGGTFDDDIQPVNPDADCQQFIISLNSYESSIKFFNHALNEYDPLYVRGDCSFDCHVEGDELITDESSLVFFDMLELKLRRLLDIQ